MQTLWTSFAALSGQLEAAFGDGALLGAAFAETVKPLLEHELACTPLLPLLPLPLMEAVPEGWLG
jgi:hypothetical protein